MSEETDAIQHAALWLIGPDMPGLLRLGAEFVADRGGNIDKDIADKFGEKAVVFMSITANPEGVPRFWRNVIDGPKSMVRKNATTRGMRMLFSAMSAKPVAMRAIRVRDTVTPDHFFSIPTLPLKGAESRTL